MRLIGALGVVLLAAGAGAQTWHLENFDGGANVAAWTFDAPMQTREGTGGFWGGWYLRATGLQTSIPTLHTGNNQTPFTGNYRAAGFREVWVALRVQQSAEPVGGRRPTVMLISFNGTPVDPTDDWGAYLVGPATLAPIGTWRLFTFQVPTAQTTLPAGWSFVQFGANAPPSPDWNALCQNVDRLAFRLDDPAVTPAPQAWEIGADYIVVTSGTSCYPNCDDSTIAPCLNIQDFACFINRFSAGETRANCDGSTTVPTLNVQDFGCFLMNFANGCSGC